MSKLARLKLVRQRRALTQQQLAERAGVNRVTIARLEGGKDQPIPTTVRKLADALGVDPEDLMEPLPPVSAWDQPGLPRYPTRGGVREPKAQTLLDPDDGDALSAHRLVVSDRPGVTRLLQKQPGLATLVNEAADQLVSFIPDARLSLELLMDPDYGEGDQLFLRVSTSLPDHEALEALRRFDQHWWVHHAQRAGGLLCIDLSDE